MKITIISFFCMILFCGCSDPNRQYFHYIYDGKDAALKRALDNGLNPNLSDGKNYTLLHAAALYGRKYIVTELINRKARIDIKDDVMWETPLMKAASAGEFEVVKILYSNGAVLNGKNRYSKNALMLACMAQTTDYKLLDFLISQGLDPEAVDDAGNTALLWAVFQGRKDAIRYLAEKRVNPNRKNKYGATIWELSFFVNTKDMPRFLKEVFPSIEGDINKKPANPPMY